MHKIKILVIAFLAINGLKAQQESNYTFYRDFMNIINPAFAGSNGTELGLNIRSQWSNIDNSPETQTIIASHDFGNNVGLGLTLRNDKIYVEKELSVAIDFSYKVILDRVNALYFGLKTSFNSYDVNLGSLGEQGLMIDPTLYGINGNLKPNFGAGAMLKGEKYFISFSVPNVLSSKKLKNEGEELNFGANRAHWYLTGGYDFDLGNSLVFMPSANLRYTNAAPISLDLTSTLRIHEILNIGAAYRLKEGYSGILSFTFNEHIKLGYAYESPFETNIQGLGNGTHEVILKFGF